jgi:hypothetical protein
MIDANRIKLVLLACFVSLVSVAAMAQSGTVSDGKTGDIAPGGCTPIGMTARGELVFPIQCRELLDRVRGPIADQQLSEPKPQSEPPPHVDSPVTKSTEVADPDQPGDRSPKGKSSRIAKIKQRHRSRETDTEATGSIGASHPRRED